MGHSTIYRIIFYCLLIATATVNQASILNKAATIEQPLTVAFNKTSFPYQFVNKQGQADGLMIDLLQLWAKKQQVELSFVPLSWQETLTQVKIGAIDIHAGLGVTEQRKHYLDFSSTLFSVNNYFYLHQQLNDVKTIEQLAPYTIGVVEGSSIVNAIKQKYPYLKIKTYPSRTAKYQAALNGEILVFAGIDKQSQSITGADAIRQLFPVSKRLLFTKRPYAIAVAKGNKTLLNTIEQGLAKISPEDKANIERKWLGIDKQSDALLIAFSPKIPPYMGLSPAGKPQGLFVDLWRLWSKYTGQKIDFIAEDLIISENLVRQNNADVIAAFPESDSSQTGLRQAWPIYQATSKVYVANKIKNINQLADLNNYKVGVFDTSPYLAELTTNYPKIIIKRYRNITNLINDAENGVIDAMIAATDIMDNQLIKHNLQSSFYLLEQPIFISNLYALVAYENVRLAEMITDGFNHIPVDEYIALEKKWLPTKKNLYFEQRNKMLALSSEEQKWQKQHTQIKVGIVNNWRPMEFVDDEGQIKGIDVDIFNLISSRTHLALKYVVFDTWQSLYNALLSKKVDMAAGISLTPERQLLLDFSKSYWDLPWVVLHRQHLGNNLNLKDFYGKKIAVVKGYHLIEKIVTNYPQISLIFFNSGQSFRTAICEVSHAKSSITDIAKVCKLSFLISSLAITKGSNTPSTTPC
jgi:ABC-type amino acid transport substrate-binding protein